MKHDQNEVKICRISYCVDTNIGFWSQIIFVEYWYIFYALLANHWKTCTAKVNRWLFKLKINYIIFW
jgi:hypothetical protein